MLAADLLIHAPFAPSPSPSPSPSGAGKCDGVFNCVADSVLDHRVGMLPSLRETGDMVKGAADTVSFAMDPMGFIANRVQGDARSFIEATLGGLAHVTRPDVSAEWFLKIYALNFGLSIILMGAIILWQFLQAARGKRSGKDLIDSLVFQVPFFLIGSMFGPAIATVAISIANGLTDLFLSRVLGKTFQDVNSNIISGMLQMDSASVAGGATGVIVMSAGVMVATVFILIALIGSNLALTCSGTVFPLGFVWGINPSTRTTARKILVIWFALLFTPPLVFLVLGVVMTMLSNTTFDALGEGMRAVVSVLTSAVGLFLVALSPMLLSKFAPVLPITAMADGPSGGVPDASAGGARDGEGGGSGAVASRAGMGSVAPSSEESMGGSSSGRIEALGETGDAAPGSGVAGRASQGAELGAAAGGVGAPAGAAAGAGIGAAEDGISAGQAAAQDGAAAASGATDSGESTSDGSAGQAGVPDGGDSGGVGASAGAVGEGVPQDASDAGGSAGDDAAGARSTGAETSNRAEVNPEADASGDASVADSVPDANEPEDSGSASGTGGAGAMLAGLRRPAAKAGQVAQSIGDLAVDEIEQVTDDVEQR